METIKKFLFIDERTNRFSSSKLVYMLSFYLIIFVTIKALNDDKEIKNDGFLTNLLLVTSGTYIGRRFSFKTKGLEVGGESKDETK